jgi:hypothetical protein
LLLLKKKFFFLPLSSISLTHTHLRTLTPTHPHTHAHTHTRTLTHSHTLANSHTHSPPLLDSHSFTRLLGPLADILKRQGAQYSGTDATCSPKTSLQRLFFHENAPNFWLALHSLELLPVLCSYCGVLLSRCTRVALMHNLFNCRASSWFAFNFFNSRVTLTAIDEKAARSPRSKVISSCAFVSCECALIL